MGKYSDNPSELNCFKKLKIGCHDLSFLSFKPAFSLSCFTFIKRLFSSSLLSAIGVILSAYLYWYFSQQSWLHLGVHPTRHFAWYILHISLISRVTIYDLDILLSLFGTSLLQSIHRGYTSPKLGQKAIFNFSSWCSYLLLSVTPSPVNSI